MLQRIGAVIGAVQVLTIAALQVVAWLRKRRQGPVNFPRTEPDDFATAEGTAAIFMYGGDLYADMLAAIRAAEHSIYFETFIWKGDKLGQEFKDAFIEAAARGVEVYVVWDRFANLVVDPDFYRFPDSVHARQHPIYLRWPRGWRLGKLARNHRKVLVVDGETAWVGGYNIGSLYVNDWRDTHARLSGPIAADLADAFVDYWNAIGGPRQPLLAEPIGRAWHTSARVVRNVPAYASYPIRGMYLEAIDRASQRIWLTHAYLIPDQDLLEALLKAARRGVDVRVIIPAESNHIEADWLSRGFYRQLLEAGVRLFLYQEAMVHAKTATIDGQWATIGTANLDRLSLVGNYEINVEFIDPAVAQRMETIFSTDLTNCRELTLDEWQSRPLMAKWSEAVLRPLRPLL
ncbi:cardiolipin synthase [Raineyella antarctica]|uniref:Cardiolipin synthase n=1 Tax=Raineyella antarctica TaxID=1577474 RepID=A0A1G6H5E7_9ACTN|nr:cardiolipin synthase [Raineyella antarctica]